MQCGTVFRAPVLQYWVGEAELAEGTTDDPSTFVQL